MILTRDRRDLYHPLADIKSIPEQVLNKLTAIGLTTAEELRDYWQHFDKTRLINYLDLSPMAFMTTGLAQSGSHPHRGHGGMESAGVDWLNLPVAPLRSYPRGVILPEARESLAASAPQLGMPVSRTMGALAGAGLGADPGLIQGRNLAANGDRFPLVRDQGPRGTCVAFASVAVLEYHRYPKIREDHVRHSEQFVYWACKQKDNLPNTDGTYISVGQQVLAKEGGCTNRLWPYDPVNDPALPIDQGPPPEEAASEAAVFLSEHSHLHANDPETIIKCIDEGRPLAISVATFRSWDSDLVRQTGEIKLPIPGEQPDGGHAVCIVGYEKRSDIPSGGIFIFRNSWGEIWGREHGRFGPGYGSFDFEYVRSHALEAFG